MSFCEIYVLYNIAHVASHGIITILSARKLMHNKQTVHEKDDVLWFTSFWQSAYSVWSSELLYILIKGLHSPMQAWINTCQNAVKLLAFTKA